MVEAPKTDEAPLQEVAHPPSPGAKLAIEAGPLAVFFVANWKLGIITATGAFMVAITLSLLFSWRLERRLPPMALFTAFFVLVFGGLTLWLQDELFIQLKPTIVNTLFAAILGAGLLVRKPLLKFALDAALHLTDAGWRALTVRWIVFLLFLATLNEYVRRTFSPDAWVNFKVFGIMPLTLLFMLTLVPLIRRHQLPEESGEKSGEGNEKDGRVAG